MSFSFNTESLKMIPILMPLEEMPPQALGTINLESLSTTDSKFKSLKLEFSTDNFFQAWILLSKSVAKDLIPIKVEARYVTGNGLRSKLESLSLEDRRSYVLQHFLLNITRSHEGGYKLLISPKMLGGGACGSKPSSVPLPAEPVNAIVIAPKNPPSTATQVVVITPVQDYFARNSPPSIYTPPPFQALDKLRDTKELAKILDLLPMGDRNYKTLQALALAVIELFSQKDGKTMPLIKETVALAESGNIDVSRTLIKILVREINKQELLDVDILNGLSFTLRNSPADSLDADDLMQILRMVMQKIRLLHKQEGTSFKLYSILKVTSDILDAMGDANVVDASRLDLHDPLYDILDQLASHSEMAVAAEAAYAKQALVRVPNDESKLSNFLRRGCSITKGILCLGKVLTDKDPSQLIESFQNFKEAWKHQESAKSWQNEVRMMKILIDKGAFVEIEKFARKVVIETSNPLMGGNLLNLLFDTILNHPETAISLSSLCFMSELFHHDEKWGTDKKLKKEVLAKLLYCAGMANLEIRGAARRELLSLKTRSQTLQLIGLLDAILPDDLNSLTIRVPTKIEEASTLLLTLALRSSFETLEQKIYRVKEKSLNDDYVTKELATFIPIQGSRSLFDPKEKTFYLETAITEFLDGNKPVLLLVGESGGGKSTYLRYLERKLWQTWNPSVRIPLFISLPSLKSPFHDAILEALKALGFTEQECKELKSNYSFLFILDGYDELKSRNNFYTCNRLHEWKGQVIITCRTQFLMGDRASYQNFFLPQSATLNSSASLDQVAVSPFTSEQIEAYCRKFIEMNAIPRTWEQYQKDFASVPDLKEIIETPFLLRIIVEVLPGIIEKHRQTQSNDKLQLLHIEIFDAFVTNWFHREEQRLLGVWNEPFDVKKEFATFAKKLALDMIEAARVSVDYEEMSTLFSSPVDNKWAKYFASKPDQLALVRSGVPLRAKTVGNTTTYAFIHKSLLEYFGARAIVSASGQSPSHRTSSDLEYKQQEVSTTAIKPIIHVQSVSIPSVLENKQQEVTHTTSKLVSPSSVSYETLNRTLLSDEKEIIKLIAETVAKDPSLEVHFFDIIERSKTDPTAAIAAANAITILNTAAVSFSNRDFRGIRIPGADLSHAILYNADLSGADLRKVRMYDSNLTNASLVGANVEGLDFGEKFRFERSEWIWSVAATPDGKSLISCMDNGYISYWNITTGQLVKQTKAHNARYIEIALSSDGKQMLSASSDMTIRLWDIESEEEILCLKGHTGTVECVGFSSDRKLAISGGGHKDESVRLWDLTNGTEIFSTLTKSWVQSVALSPNGKYALYGCSKGCYLIDLDDKKQRACASGVVSCVIFTPDSKNVLFTENNLIMLYEIGSDKIILRLEGHANLHSGNSINSLAISPNEKYLLSGGDDMTVRLWDLSDGGREVFCFQGHTNAVTSVAFTSDGEHAISGSKDSTIRLWDLKRVKNFKMKEINYVNGFTDFSNDGKYALIGNQQTGSASLWNLNLGKQIHKIQAGGKYPCLFGVALSPDNTMALLNTGDGIYGGIYLWDLVLGKNLKLCTDKGARGLIAFSPCGKKFIAQSNNPYSVQLYDLDLAKEMFLFKGHTNTMYGLTALSPDGKYALTGSTDKTACILDIPTGNLVHRLQLDECVWAVAFSRDSQKYLTAGDGSIVHLWDINDHKELLSFKGHRNKICTLSLSYDGNYLLSGSDDCTVRLWDLNSGKELYKIESSYKVKKVHFLSDSRHFLLEDNQPSMKLWQVFDEEGKLSPSCLWSSGGALSAKGLKMQGIIGLSEANQLLLKQLAR